ncbi:MAG: glycosyltransferase [Chloroflexota bacterium]|jgi:UDP:flavonoid glycosyltransferase YjiC (YdhE family)
MRVLIPTIGSRGDVQPFIALAQGLEQAGHAARLMSHPGMRSLVEDHGVTFSPMGPEIDMAWEAAVIRQQPGHTLSALRKIMNLAFDTLGQAHEEILAAGRDADLVVVPASSAAGKNEAELLGLPIVSVDFMPWTIPINDPRRSLFKRAAYAAINKIAETLTSRPLNKLRRQQGLPPVGPEGFRSTSLNLVPISPLIFAPDPCWAPIHHAVGYWFVEEPQGWRPPVDLLTFLDVGPAPLVVSLGAMSQGPTGPGSEMLEMAYLFVEAITAAGVRAIIQGWEAALKELALPPTIYPAGPLPHSWLLRRAAGLVHHGGFGTTAAGFQAGIPQLIIPHMVDQFYWGQRVGKLGAGPPAIGRSKLTSDKLASALHDLAHNAELSATSSRLGEQIRAEPGPSGAIRLIDESSGGVGE